MILSIIYMVAIVTLVGCAVLAIAVHLIDKNVDRHNH
jgi:hypothetical protein